MIRTIKGQIIGEQSLVFNYSGQRLISIAEYNRRKQEELSRVRNLKIQGMKSKWIGKGGGRQTNCVTKTTSHGSHGSEQTQIHEAMTRHNIRTISDLKSLQIDQLPLVRGIQSI